MTPKPIWRVLCMCLLLGIGAIFAMSAIAAEPLDEADRLAERAKREWGQTDWAVIQRMLDRAIALRQSVLSADDPSLAPLLDALGKTFYNRDQYASAESNFGQALAIAESVRGPRNLEVADYLGDLGATLREEGRYGEGEVLVRRSLEIRRSLLPADDPVIAGSLNNLGRNYLRQRRYAEAETALAESVEIYRKALGPTHRLVRQTETLLNDARSAGEANRRYVETVLRAAIAFASATIVLLVLIVWAERARAGGRNDASLGFSILFLLAQLGSFVAAFLLGDLTIGQWLIDRLADPSWSRAMLQGIGKIAGLFGVWVASIAGQLLANGVRRILGLPAQPLVFFNRQPFRHRSPKRDLPAAGPQRNSSLSVGRALLWGHLWINLPVMTIILTMIGITFYLSDRYGRDIGGEDYSVVGFFGGLLLAVALAWVWWSINVPKWRLWAMTRVEDWPELKQRAVASGLIWPDGHFFNRTEIKSDAQRRLQEQLEQKFRSM